jgi:DnaJ-class molecular chaperone
MPPKEIWEQCGTCYGNGVIIVKGQEVTCKACKGSGFIRKS